MKIDQLLLILFPPNSNKQPTTEQLSILKHPAGPAWVLAGPGSGKTEVLSLMVLRLLYVSDDPIQKLSISPESIFVTTFTDKAARNLEDRIGQYRKQIIAAHPELESVDISKLRIGTLHGLCNDLLQEFRAPNYQNVRLMDEFEQAMFIYEHMSIVASKDFSADQPFWEAFDYMFTPQEWKPTYDRLPNKWVRTSKLITLFNRIVEDNINIAAMRAASPHWARLADLYDEYVTKLIKGHRSDFAHLQSRFLEFLPTPLGRAMLDGEGTGRPGIEWVLVDEYQDTNLIQEAIYMALAHRSPHNIVVVGDDDQAMYRFRGGSVECMVTFDQACQVYLGIAASAVKTYPLIGNFRSHPEIVEFCNTYVTAFQTMNIPGARVPSKPLMQSKSRIAGKYPAVGILTAKTADDTANEFAQTIVDLIRNGVVTDPSQCCLLLTSTKETPNNAQKYVEALRRHGLKPYNPRNKAFLEQQEVSAMLGAISSLIDPDGIYIPPKPDELNEFILMCRMAYQELLPSHPPLKDYIDRSVAAFSDRPGAYVNSTLQEIVYYVLSCSPFDGWHADPERRVRLGKLTALFEAFASMPVPERDKVQRGSMRVDPESPYTIHRGWVRGFYSLFFGYLARTGFDEVSDEQIICPPGYVPVMTIHQAKGLQFPFVFVGHISKKPAASATHRLESELGAFPGNPARAFSRPTAAVRAELDLIRQFYVAYSRAEWALVMVGSSAQLTGGGVPCGPEKNWLRRNVRLL
ncbi:UvrD-helicase domain-containing protein [Herbaspirillum rhizosphaerae]|uniref:UvrD-helicase domain-containing protein n=1 Tax=Herbaspirillum rhizosphaerae TaxID=346179 RepID=UPI0009FA8BCA|nr:ATP-dependent helicase [Herbaspirillum rhizosphaerae]